MTLKCCHTDVDATSLRRIDVIPASFNVMCLLGAGPKTWMDG